jgi:hypothetical protein
LPPSTGDRAILLVAVDLVIGWNGREMPFEALELRLDRRVIPFEDPQLRANPIDVMEHGAPGPFRGPP